MRPSTVACAEQNKHRRCREQPQWILTHALAPYLHTGRLELAAAAHRAAYPGMRSGATWLHGTALHLVLCGLTGNEPRGLELIEWHLDWLDVSPSPFHTMKFASGAAFVLRRLAGTGRGDLTVRDRRTGRPGETTIEALHRELLATATAIARNFDRRNGNDYHTCRLLRRVDQESVAAALTL